MPAPAAALLAHLRSRQGEMVDLLARLTALESPSRVPAALGPVFDLLAAALGELGFRTRQLSGPTTGGQLFAVPKVRRRGLPVQLLLGHADTVWPLGTLARMPVALSGGRLSGPGIYDMKGGLVQGIFALKALRDLGLTPAATPVFFINSDEEVGSDDSTRSLVRLAKRMRRVWVLEPSLGAQGKLKTERKGVGQFNVSVYGKSSHAGLAPEQGASAILEMARLILRLAGLADPARGITINVGEVHGGAQANVVAAEAHAQVDLRVRTVADGERLALAITSLRAETPGTRIEVVGGLDRPPLERTAANRALYALAQTAAAQLGIEIDEGSVGGGSDGSTTSVYAPTLDGLGAVGDGAHALHEFVDTDRMPERAALVALLLLAPAA